MSPLFPQPTSLDDSICFGSFRISLSARTLERNGVPLEIGSRALDILIALIERAGEVVSHRELMTKVWRGLVVDGCNLRVNIAHLRKVLGDAGACIQNIPCQGYRFDSAAVRFNERGQGPIPVAWRQVLPPEPSCMIGREETIEEITRRLLSHRFVTLLGPGGVGKTWTAIAVAHRLKQRLAGAIHFIDLASVSGPAALDRKVWSDDASLTLIDSLRSHSMLLLLDNCEHLVDGVARVAEEIYREATGVCILATSREALRVDGEHVFQVAPLATPPLSEHLKATEALAYPAVELFMQRAIAANASFALNDANAWLVSQICHRLGGIPLAMDIAAGRAATNGISDTARLLGSCFGLHWQGRRTAVPRHQTMQSVLDWSFNLLPTSERVVLCRLATLVEAFTIEAAQFVAADSRWRPEEVAVAVEQLVAKSLLATSVADDGATQYRLLESTRVYARARLSEIGDADCAVGHDERFEEPSGPADPGRLQ